MSGHILKRAGRVVLPAIAAAALGWGFTGSVRAEEDSAKIEKLFREAVDLYQTGKKSEAQLRMREVLSLDPREQIVSRLVEEAGTRIMARMMSDAQMGNEPGYVWQLYRKYQVSKLADTERMTKMAAALVARETTSEDRARVMREIAELGHNAIPFIAPHLMDASSDEARAYARLAIGRMGPRAVLPVAALLSHSNELMRQNAALLLGDIVPHDSRGIPALKAALEKPDQTAPVKAVCASALRKISGLDEKAWKSASEYYYDLANRYFLDRSGVAEEAEDLDGTVWHLNEGGMLVSIKYPLWAWNDQMAEEMLVQGLKNAPDYAPFQPLWAAVQAGQRAEADELAAVVSETQARHNFSAEEKAQLLEHQKKLAGALKLVYAAGREHVNSALTKVLADLKKYPGHTRLPQTAVELANALGVLDPKGTLLVSGAGTSALLAGLDCTDLSVQYACALSLAKINAYPAQWAGADKVGAILARGVTENKSVQILLVEENPNNANILRQRLQSQGYGVTVAISGRDAVIQARSFPPKEVAVISDNLRRDLSAEQVIEELRADSRTRYMAPGILHANKDRTVTQARFGSDAALVEREMEGNDLKGAVEKLVEKASGEPIAKTRAKKTSADCSAALASLAPSATHISLDLAIDAAIQALTNRPDDVRIPMAKFLGKTAGGKKATEAATALRAVIEDAGASVDLRVEALKAIGQVKTEGLDDVYTKAQSDPEQRVQDAAAEAFGQVSRPGKAVTSFTSAYRVDKDKKEK